jgi:hypothetical protein
LRIKNRQLKSGGPFLGGAECLLLAQSGHANRRDPRQLSGVKRTPTIRAVAAAFDPKRTFNCPPDASRTRCSNSCKLEPRWFNSRLERAIACSSRIIAKPLALPPPKVFRTVFRLGAPSSL